MFRFMFFVWFAVVSYIVSASRDDSADELTKHMAAMVVRDQKTTTSGNVVTSSISLNIESQRTQKVTERYLGLKDGKAKFLPYETNLKDMLSATSSADSKRSPDRLGYNPANLYPPEFRSKFFAQEFGDTIATTGNARFAHRHSEHKTVDLAVRAARDLSMSPANIRATLVSSTRLCYNGYGIVSCANLSETISHRMSAANPNHTFSHQVFHGSPPELHTSTSSSSSHPLPQSSSGPMRVSTQASTSIDHRRRKSDLHH
jgi:hypothetical protein